jgi:adenylate cyclase
VGRLSEVTVLFADARGFTALIHERGPEEITPFIDEFFKRCSKIVVNHDGIIDNFRGDAVLGFFNVPIKRDDHVARAISAATDIQLAVPEINLSKGQEDLLKVGVGITTGLALTAMVGSSDCKDYTVMGDVANFEVDPILCTGIGAS